MFSAVARVRADAPPQLLEARGAVSVGHAVHCDVELCEVRQHREPRGGGRVPDRDGDGARLGGATAGAVGSASPPTTALLLTAKGVARTALSTTACDAAAAKGAAGGNGEAASISPAAAQQLSPASCAAAGRARGEGGSNARSSTRDGTGGGRADAQTWPEARSLTRVGGKKRRRA